MRIRYLGTGPGQAAHIRVVNIDFRRGEVTDVPDALGMVLLQREGWEHADASPAPPASSDEAPKRRGRH